MLTIKYGVNTITIASADGKSVADLRSEVESILNVPGDAQARVNGAQVSEDYLPSDSQTIEFVKAAGEKGAVTIKYGVNTITIQTADGKTVCDIRDEVASILNVPCDAQVRIDGSSVDENSPVSDNCSIEFVKAAGEKGN